MGMAGIEEEDVGYNEKIFFNKPLLCQSQHLMDDGTFPICNILKFRKLISNLPVDKQASHC